MTKILQIEVDSAKGDYFLACKPNGISMGRGEPSESGEIIKIKPLTEFSLYPRTLLFCTIDISDGNYLYTRTSTMEKLRELAKSGHRPTYNQPLLNLDFELVGASYFGETILGTIQNKEPFVEIVIKCQARPLDDWQKRDPNKSTSPWSYNFYRIYLDSLAVVGIDQLEDYNFLTGHYLPGFTDYLDEIYLEPFYGELVRVKRELTTTNSYLNRTVYEFTQPVMRGDKLIKFVVLEWRPILLVHQYYYEIYSQCEYYCSEPEERDQANNERLLEQLFEKISDFSQPIVTKPNFAQVIRRMARYGATSARPNHLSDIELVKGATPNLEQHNLLDVLGLQTKSIVKNSETKAEVKDSQLKVENLALSDANPTSDTNAPDPTNASNAHSNASSSDDNNVEELPPPRRHSKVITVTEVDSESQSSQFDESVGSTIATEKLDVKLDSIVKSDCGGGDDDGGGGGDRGGEEDLNDIVLEVVNTKINRLTPLTLRPIVRANSGHKAQTIKSRLPDYSNVAPRVDTRRVSLRPKVNPSSITNIHRHAHGQIKPTGSIKTGLNLKPKPKIANKASK